MSCSYELMCENCGYRDVFRFGLGFLYNWEMLFDFHKENDLLERLVITKSNYETIKDLIINQHAMVSSDYGHDIYYCSCCGTFHEGFFIHLDYNGGEFEPKYICNVCGVPLERTKFEEEEICHRWHLNMLHEKYPCPMCGEFSLKRDYSI